MSKSVKDNLSNCYKPARSWINKSLNRLKILYLKDWILRFQNECNKMAIELLVAQFWSEIILEIIAKSTNHRIDHNNHSNNLYPEKKN